MPIFTKVALKRIGTILAISMIFGIITYTSFVSAEDANTPTAEPTIQPTATPKLPKTPSVDGVITNTSTFISGHGTAYGLITVQYNDQTLTGKSSEWSHWKVKLPTTLSVGTIVSVSVTSVTGITSKVNTFTVKPAAPTINPVTPNSTHVSGKTLGYARVYAKIGNWGRTLFAKRNGYYSVPIKKYRGGTQVSVRITVNELQSEYKSVIVY